MDEQLAVVVGAGLGAVGGLLGAVVGLVGARTQARAQIEIVRLQAVSQHESELVSKRREAYGALGLAVDAVRRHLEETASLNQRITMDREEDEALERDRAEAVVVRDRLLLAAQEAEWRIRILLTRPEQDAITVLMQAMVKAVNRSANWRFTIFETSMTSADTLDAEDEFRRAQSELRDQLMGYADTVHRRLGGAPVVARRRWLRRRTS